MRRRGSGWAGRWIGGCAVGPERRINDVVEEGLDLQVSLAGLAAGGGDDEDEGFGTGVESVDDENGRDGAFAPLAIAVESDALEEVGILEDVNLGGFGLEAQEFFGEVEGAEGEEEDVQDFFFCDGGDGWRSRLCVSLRGPVAGPGRSSSALCG